MKSPKMWLFQVLALLGLLVLCTDALVGLLAVAIFPNSYIVVLLLFHSMMMFAAGILGTLSVLKYRRLRAAREEYIKTQPEWRQPALRKGY